MPGEIAPIKQFIFEFDTGVQMTLRTELIRAVRGGQLGHNGQLTRQEFMRFFAGWNVKTTGCFLSNSEMTEGSRHSPTYRHFTRRIGRGIYQIHPASLNENSNKEGT